MTLIQSLETILQNPLYFTLLIIWTLIWKGIALWKSSRHGQMGWFIALLIVSTAGLLEIAYILWFQKERNKS